VAEVRLPFLVTLTLLLGPTSCGASASISSARDSSVALRVSRLFVAVEPGGVDPDLAVKLAEALRNELQQRSVAVKTHVLTGLDEVDRNAVDAFMKAWHPEGILIAAPAGGSGTYGDRGDVSFDMSLISVPANKRIWRAQVFTRKSLGTDSGVATETAESVGGQLERDGFIGARR
jgi:hypothetical protein